jgi:hypothetical protein
LTRQSIFFERLMRRGIDCRVKPGNDGESVEAFATLASRSIGMPQ